MLSFVTPIILLIYVIADLPEVANLDKGG